MSVQDDFEKGAWQSFTWTLRLGRWLAKVLWFIGAGIGVFAIKKLLVWHRKRQREGVPVSKFYSNSTMNEGFYVLEDGTVTCRSLTVHNFLWKVFGKINPLIAALIAPLWMYAAAVILLLILQALFGVSDALAGKILIIALLASPVIGYYGQKKTNETAALAQANAENLRKESLRVGEKLYLPQKKRYKHMYVVGKTGSGKSKAMLNWLLQDIFNGRGCAFIDPHGDTFKECLEHIAKKFVTEKKSLDDLEKEELLKKLVIIDPTDKNHAVGLNPLQKLKGESDLRVGLRFESTVKKLWGFDLPEAPRMGEITRFSVAAMAANGLTLIETIPFLTDGRIRAKLAQKVKNNQIRHFLTAELADYAKQRDDPLGSTKRRIRTFTTDEAVIAIIGQRKSTLRVREAMDGEHVILCKIPTGPGGEGMGDLGRFLGSLLVSQFHHAASSRSDIEEDERKHFYLYIDEFQNFISGNFPSILAEMRKYGLHFVLAHQYTEQGDKEFREDVQNAIFGNVGTMMAFQVKATDAKLLADEFFALTGKMVKNVKKRLEILDLGLGLKVPILKEEEILATMSEESQLYANLFVRMKERDYYTVYEGSETAVKDKTVYLPNPRDYNKELIDKYVERIKEICSRRWARPKKEVLKKIEERQSKLLGQPEYRKPRI